MNAPWPDYFARETFSGLDGIPNRIDVCYFTQPDHGFFQYGVDYADGPGVAARREEALKTLKTAVAKLMAAKGHSLHGVIWGRLPLYGAYGEFL